MTDILHLYLVHKKSIENFLSSLNYRVSKYEDIIEMRLLNNALHLKQEPEPKAKELKNLTIRKM